MFDQALLAKEFRLLESGIRRLYSLWDDYNLSGIGPAAVFSTAAPGLYDASDDPAALEAAYREYNAELLERHGHALIDVMVTANATADVQVAIVSRHVRTVIDERGRAAPDRKMIETFSIYAMEQMTEADRHMDLAAHARARLLALTGELERLQRTEIVEELRNRAESQYEEVRAPAQGNLSERQAAWIGRHLQARLNDIQLSMERIGNDMAWLSAMDSSRQLRRLPEGRHTPEELEVLGNMGGFIDQAAGTLQGLHRFFRVFAAFEDKRAAQPVL